MPDNKRDSYSGAPCKNVLSTALLEVYMCMSAQDFVERSYSV